MLGEQDIQMPNRFSSHHQQSTLGNLRDGSSSDVFHLRTGSRSSILKQRRDPDPTEVEFPPMSDQEMHSLVSNPEQLASSSLIEQFMILQSTTKRFLTFLLILSIHFNHFIIMHAFIQVQRLLVNDCFSWVGWNS